MGEETDRDVMLRKLIDIQYVRNDTLLGRGRFRVKGDVIEIQPAYSETAYRVSMFGDEVEQITHFDPLTGEVFARLDTVTVFPATQYVTSKPTIERAQDEIKHELEQQVALFESEGRMLEAHRIRQRTEYDMEMMRELGFCNGIENYSRILDGRPPGSAPHTLLDYFPSDYVVFVDESHQTVPQIGGMYEGDRSRKQTLVEHGFRLPSALDNRPLRFDEFLDKVHQLVFVSATPGPFELRHSQVVAEQLIRPTYLVDPEVELRPTRNQIDDLLNEIRRREEAGERVLVTTLTKKMAEDLTDYLLEAGVRARYLHSEIDTLERIQIIRELRLGEYDVLVGINLLREGLDLPEVSLVAILDADKEGFLRGKTALVQTIGRAARNINGRVLLYADKRTEAIQAAMEETERRRSIQLAYNEENGTTPVSRREGRLGHRRVPLARESERPWPPAAGRARRGRGDVARGAREARRHARGGDVRRRRGAALRVRGQAARRDQGAAPRARRPSRNRHPGGLNNHVPEHQDAAQLRAARDRGGDPRRGAPVRAQDQRRDEAVEGERGRLRARGRGGHGRLDAAARSARHVGAAARPRGRGGARPRARREALRRGGVVDDIRVAVVREPASLDASCSTTYSASSPTPMKSDDLRLCSQCTPRKASPGKSVTPRRWSGRPEGSSTGSSIHP